MSSSVNMAEERKAPAVPRLSATVLLLRDDPLQVLMVKRHDRGQYASALVFPGGVVDDSDRDERWLPLLKGAEGLSDDDRALRIAAVRETFEETGILLTEGVSECPDRRENGDFRAMVERLGLRIDVGGLEHFAHWVTARIAPKRYDTHFLLAVAPHGQAAACDGDETVSLEWVTPQQAIDQGARGDAKVVFPTRLQLQRLGESRNVTDALAAARGRPHVVVEPEMLQTSEGVKVHIPAEAGYGGAVEEWVRRF